MSHETSSPGELKLTAIDSVSALQSNIKKIKEFECLTVDNPLLLYYRGLSNESFDRNPSVLRCMNHYENEGAMLRELMTRRPDEFVEFKSALDRWMLAQHHGLCTRFIDISLNLLAGLFFACGGFDGNAQGDGVLYAFSTTHYRVKPYDSDSVSIIANFARLRKMEQDAILEKTKYSPLGECAFVDRSRRIMFKRVLT